MEQSIVEELQRRGMLTVHPTPCKNRRHCIKGLPSESVGVCDLSMFVPPQPPVSPQLGTAAVSKA